MNQQTTAKNQHRCRPPKYTDSKSAAKFFSITVFLLTQVRVFLKQSTIVFFHQIKPFAIKMCKMLENHTQTPATCHNHQFQSVEIESLHVSEAQSIYKFSLVVWPFHTVILPDHSNFAFQHCQEFIGTQNKKNFSVSARDS